MATIEVHLSACIEAHDGITSAHVHVQPEDERRARREGWAEG